MNETFIINNSDWYDSDGNRISAHDGYLSNFGDMFYWYGSNYKGNPDGKWGPSTAGLQNGFNVYSSKNLTDWTYEGVCLNFPSKGQYSQGTSHRPGVIYNDRTGMFVMWFYYYVKFPGVMLTVAVSRSPTGPFEIAGIRKSGEEHGYAQDMGIFKDDDGKAYVVYDDCSRNIRVDLLTDDYLDTTRSGVIALTPEHEASAMIRYTAIP